MTSIIRIDGGIVLLSTATPAHALRIAILGCAFFFSGCGEEIVVVAPPEKPEVSVFRVKAKDTPVATDFVGKTASSRRVEIRSRVEGFLE